MHEFVVVADVHEGINFGYQVDPETGISARALDLHRNLIRAVEFALEHGSRYFVIVGDLFDRTHVAPVYRELIRNDVIEPLGAAGIKIWLIGGNHDLPRNPKKGTSLDDFRGYPHVNVYKMPTRELVEVEGKRIAVLLLPYLHPENIAAMVKEKLGEELKDEEVTFAAQSLLKNWLHSNADVECESKILFAHYYVEGAKLSETIYNIIPETEFKFAGEMLPNVDFAVFGHIHLHQKMRIGDKEVIYPGAIERIDWGEREDRKGFVTLSPLELTWEFIELPARPMIKLDVEVAAGEDALRKVLDALPDVEAKLVRLQISLPEGVRRQMDEERIKERLMDAFHYELRFAETHGEKLGFVTFTADPFELLDKFITQNYQDDPRRDELLQEGREILREVLQ